jgi:hypothetical protein
MASKANSLLTADFLTPRVPTSCGSPERIALHMEMRDTYASADPDFAAWQVGELTDRSDSDAEWRSIIGPLVDREVDDLDH